MTDSVLELKLLDIFRTFFKYGLAPMFTFLAGWVGVRAGLRQIKAQQRHEFILRQIRELYSPLLGCYKDIRSKTALRRKVADLASEAWHEIVERSPNPFLGSDKAYEPFKKIIDYNNDQLVEELLPLYRQMLKIFRDNYYLAEPDTANLYSALSDFIDIWDRVLARSLPFEVNLKLEHGGKDLDLFFEELEKRHSVLRGKLAG